MKNPLNFGERTSGESRLERIFKPKLRNFGLHIITLFLILRFGSVAIANWVASWGGIFVAHELVTFFFTTVVIYVAWIIALLGGDELLYRYGFR